MPSANHKLKKEEDVDVLAAYDLVTKSDP